jgi:hypothetical protein
MITKTKRVDDPKPKRSSRRKLQTWGLTLLRAEAALAQTTVSWNPKKELARGPIRSGHLLFLSGFVASAEVFRF